MADHCCVEIWVTDDLHLSSPLSLANVICTSSPSGPHIGCAAGEKRDATNDDFRGVVRQRGLDDHSFDVRRNSAAAQKAELKPNETALPPRRSPPGDYLRAQAHEYPRAIFFPTLQH